MENKQLIKFKRLINAKTLEIKNRLVTNSSNQLDSDGDEVDTIQAKILAEIDSRLSSRDINKLKRLERALDRIKDGSFGDCDECGEEISEKRLEFDPTFESCVICAERLEKNSR